MTATTPTAANQMMELAKGMIFGPPIWVWFLLVLLVVLGVRSFKKRRVPILVFYFTPLLALLSIQNVNNLPHEMAAWISFVVTYSASALLSYRWQGGQILQRTRSHILLAGEWVSLVSFMVVFWANFVQGFIVAVNPAIYEGAGFAIIFAGVLGSASGNFLGRPLRNLLAKENETQQPETMIEAG